MNSINKLENRKTESENPSERIEQYLILT